MGHSMPSSQDPQVRIQNTTHIWVTPCQAVRTPKLEYKTPHTYGSLHAKQLGPPSQNTKHHTHMGHSMPSSQDPQVRIQNTTHIWVTPCQAVRTPKLEYKTPHTYGSLHAKQLGSPSQNTKHYTHMGHSMPSCQDPQVRIQNTTHIWVTPCQAVRTPKLEYKTLHTYGSLHAKQLGPPSQNTKHHTHMGHSMPSSQDSQVRIQNTTHIWVTPCQAVRTPKLEYKTPHTYGSLHAKQLGSPSQNTKHHTHMGHSMPSSQDPQVRIQNTTHIWVTPCQAVRTPKLEYKTPHTYGSLHAKQLGLPSQNTKHHTHMGHSMPSCQDPQVRIQNTTHIWVTPCQAVRTPKLEYKTLHTYGSLHAKQLGPPSQNTKHHTHMGHSMPSSQDPQVRIQNTTHIWVTPCQAVRTPKLEYKTPHTYGSLHAKQLGPPSQNTKHHTHMGHSMPSCQDPQVRIQNTTHIWVTPCQAVRTPKLEYKTPHTYGSLHAKQLGLPSQNTKHHTHMGHSMPSSQDPQVRIQNTTHIWVTPCQAVRIPKLEYKTPHTYGSLHAKQLGPPSQNTKHHTHMGHSMPSSQDPQVRIQNTTHIWVTPCQAVRTPKLEYKTPHTYGSLHAKQLGPPSQNTKHYTHMGHSMPSSQDPQVRIQNTTHIWVTPCQAVRTPKLEYKTPHTYGSLHAKQLGPPSQNTKHHTHMGHSMPSSQDPQVRIQNTTHIWVTPCQAVRTPKLEYKTPHTYGSLHAKQLEPPSQNTKHHTHMGHSMPSSQDPQVRIQNTTHIWVTPCQAVRTPKLEYKTPHTYGSLHAKQLGLPSQNTKHHTHMGHSMPSSQDSQVRIQNTTHIWVTPCQAVRTPKLEYKTPHTYGSLHAKQLGPPSQNTKHHTHMGHSMPSSQDPQVRIQNTTHIWVTPCQAVRTPKLEYKTPHTYGSLHAKQLGSPSQNTKHHTHMGHSMPSSQDPQVRIQNTTHIWVTPCQAVRTPKLEYKTPHTYGSLHAKQLGPPSQNTKHHTHMGHSMPSSQDPQVRIQNTTHIWVTPCQAVRTPKLEYKTPHTYGSLHAKQLEPPSQNTKHHTHMGHSMPSSQDPQVRIQNTTHIWVTPCQAVRTPKLEYKTPHTYGSLHAKQLGPPSQNTKHHTHMGHSMPSSQDPQVRIQNTTHIWVTPCQAVRTPKLEYKTPHTYGSLHAKQLGPPSQNTKHHTHMGHSMPSSQDPQVRIQNTTHIWVTPCQAVRTPKLEYKTPHTYGSLHAKQLGSPSQNTKHHTHMGHSMPSSQDSPSQNTKHHTYMGHPQVTLSDFDKTPSKYSLDWHS